MSHLGNQRQALAVRRISRGNARGFTLIELIVATTILIILTGMAVPLAQVSIKRERERELRTALWTLRDALDRYKAAADLAWQRTIAWFNKYLTQPAAT